MLATMHAEWTKQRTVAGPYRRQFDDAPLPESMQAKALQVVDQIVARRDRGKEVIDPCRALLARTEKLVRHSETETFTESTESGQFQITARLESRTR